LVTGLFILWFILGQNIMANDVRNEFEKSYQLWKEHCKKVAYSSRLEDRFNSPYYEEIIKLGPQILPYIVEKVRSDKDFVWIAWAGRRVASISSDPNVNPWAKESMLTWWEGGQKQTNERFELLYEEWKNARARGSYNEASRIEKKIKMSLGIAVFSPIMEKLEHGDENVIPLIQDMTDNEVNVKEQSVAEKVNTYKTWWDGNKKRLTVPFPDQQAIE